MLFTCLSGAVRINVSIAEPYVETGHKLKYKGINILRPQAEEELILSAIKSTR